MAFIATALKTFTYKGVRLHKGDPVAFDSAIEAAIQARVLPLSLSKQTYTHRAMVPSDAEGAYAPIAELLVPIVTDTPPEPRRRRRRKPADTPDTPEKPKRRYRRRNLTAED